MERDVKASDNYRIIVNSMLEIRASKQRHEWLDPIGYKENKQATPKECLRICPTYTQKVGLNQRAY